ncbi:MAG: putative lipid II flippase FtsW [Gammaproteobacteria bacterium]|nr:putative lipid II flippase FtsW [Gammaproteobacteria bacterium]MBU1654208.1 putative lipid II flippase FtsW [Gammaproteobacteria bacterium]MBU1960868.1 putative lipid II flippase FtsW [Gammaproteobacteria bacterium]
MNTAVRPQATTGGMKLLPRTDYIFLFAVAALLGLGLVMVGSSSLHKMTDAPFHYLNRHLLGLGLGGAGALAMLRVPLGRLERAGPMLYFIGLVLLLILLIPGLGRTVNGATRWIPVGPMSIQASEFMKLFVVVYIGGYLVRRQEEVAHSFRGFAKPMALVLAAAGLVLLEPDFGTAVVIVATVLGMLFLGGVPVWQYGLMLTVGLLTAPVLVWVKQYRLDRVTSFMDPWADPLNTGFQLTQALIAFGRGEWIGVGLGAGIQKLFYLPEAHTDFLLAVIGEELGLAGSLTVIGLFGLVSWRGFAIGAAAETMGRRFAAYVAYGLTLCIALQAAVNIGVNLGLLPTKGLTLPFMSYGSNSILVASLMVAVLLRIDWENRNRNEEEPAWAPA